MADHNYLLGLADQLKFTNTTTIVIGAGKWNGIPILRLPGIGNSANNGKNHEQDSAISFAIAANQVIQSIATVSYTHLTLPTILLV